MMIKLYAVIFIGMLLAIVAALFFGLRSRLLFMRSRLLFTRLGFGLSALIVCVGLAYFGWQPLFGGSHPIDTWGGFVALCLGLFGFCLFGALEEIGRQLAAAPDPRPGFPVVPPAIREAP
jgi:hypothetical protein